ncbi:LPS-assembly protein LptD [Thermocrinis minervae]|uniref:LPS-assembly protein n=1 Tax=Thermocrinis minervae TaxID=381751 RepID=A0A1M6QPK8_9AQUI|nr:LPS-assembly protein LptD [Thermocrinis minervae]SHK22136.1 LPS-assembly protein [Thermocrinis minervae]
MLILILLTALSLCFSLEVYSDRLDRLPDGKLEAQGNVEIHYRDYYIKSDYALYDPESKDVYLKGNVYVKSQDGRFETTGEEGYINEEKGVGYFLKAEGRYEKFYFQAKRIDKEGDTYYVQEGSITTCPPNKKEMNLCLFRARVDQKYVFSFSNTLRLFNLPIAYSPLAAFPVGERRSGLLPPLIGSNSYNTFIYQQPIYWAISRDKDLTLTLDLRDKQAKGLSLEYRQAFLTSNDFTLDMSLYKEPTPPGKWWEGRNLSAFKENRYRISSQLSLGNLRLGIDTASDPYFLEDIYIHTKERTIPYLTSYLSYKKDWDSFLLIVDAFRFYDTTNPNNRQTIQRLPEISLYYKQRSLFSTLSIDSYLGYTNFYREEGLRSQRVAFMPELSLQKDLFGRTFLSTLTLENIYYFGVNQEGYKKSITSVRFTERVPFFFDFSLKRFDFKNFLELSYSFRPKGYNNPRFDSLDNMDKENALKFSFKNFSYAFGRQFLNLYLEGGYNTLGSFTYNGQKVKGRFFPLHAVLAFTPLDNFIIGSDTYYNFQDSKILSTSTYTSLSYKDYKATLGLVQNRDYYGNTLTNQWNASFEAQRDNLRIVYSMIHDIKTSKDLYRQLNLDYRGACWNFGVMLRDTYDGNRGKYIKEVFLTFNIFDLQRFTLPLKRQ